MERRGRYGKTVENIGANVSEWCAKTGEGSSTWELCDKHAEVLDKMPHAYDKTLVPYGSNFFASGREPSGEDGRGGDVEHPPYNEVDAHCAVCGVTLVDDF